MSNTASWVTFSKERYHQHVEMEYWCEKNIGHGGWSYDTHATWEGMEGKIWIIHSMFGNTTFTFKEAKHLTLFLLRWA